MRNLLAANFSRLWKSRLFWLLELFCFSFGVFAYTLVAINTRNLGQGWLEYNAHVYFYLPILYLPAVIAVFAGFFLGTDYSDGTIRNKLIAGYTRCGIYLSNLLITGMAAILFAAAHVAAVMIVGLPFSGNAVITHVQLHVRAVHILLILMEYVSIFVLFSMMDSSKARNVVVSLSAALLIVLVGMMVYSRYAEPEFVTQVVPLPDGGLELQKGEPNVRYLSGMLRTVYAWAARILPSGSAMLSLDKNLVFDWRNSVVSVVTMIVLVVTGIRLFQKKDVR